MYEMEYALPICKEHLVDKALSLNKKGFEPAQGLSKSGHKGVKSTPNCADVNFTKNIGKKYH